MSKKQTKILIFNKASVIKKLEKLQGEIYGELVKELELKKETNEEEVLFDYCFNSFGKLDDVIKELGL